ncbi:MAG: zinc-ribbon domain-containing protein [Syntrophobacteraceae bacterium]
MVRVQCPGCRIGFNIPDDKIPEGRALKILCPKCKAPIEINEKQHRGSAGGGDALPAESIALFVDEAISDYANEIDVVEEGVKTALLCVTHTKRAERMAQVLHELGFWVVHASRSGYALGKLHHNNYDLMVLEEEFDSDRPGGNLVLHHVQLLPMHVRRLFFLCLLSDTKPTLDAMLAFRLGVNLILNTQAIEKAKVILARAMKEYRSFYTFFSAELSRKHA